jgi:2,4-dienoyl-CoA reductase-like NADH-dependent reductase (Old Yellow Enzyme family)
VPGKGYYTNTLVKGDDKKMAELFENTTINSMMLSNRFVRSATWEGMANEDGSVTPKLIDLMVQLAQGGVGLIITGHNYICREGHSSYWQLGIHNDELLLGHTEMTEAVHKVGGKIVAQISHGGLHVRSELTGQEPLGPSVMETEKGPIGREMSLDDINETVRTFGEGAVRAQKAGFDGIQIHAAHGYLLSEFLSPFYNKRTDQYGGSIENRARIVLEVFQNIRDAVGAQFPVMIKLNSEDFIDGGFSVDDMLQVALMLEKIGIDAIELSGGTIHALYTGNPNTSFSRTVKKEVYYREAAKRYKEKIGVPLILVGGIRSYEVAKKLVEEGITDYVSMCRPLIREPDLINRWKTGDTRKAACISDNACFKPGIEGKGVQCIHISDK